MIIWGMVLGGYPRSREARHLLRDVERGVLNPSNISARLLKIHAEIIGVQKATGFPYIVDGMTDWHDIFRPFIKSWRNVSINGLLRYFDNNFFYRVPVFTGEPDIISPVLSPRVREFSSLADPARLKVVVPGPVTMVRMSRNLTGLSSEELAEKIANLLRREVEEAVAAGAGFIQVDEPFLSDIDASKDDAYLAVDLVNRIVKGFEEQSSVAVYFNIPSKDVYRVLLNVSTKYLSIDVYDAPRRAFDLIRSMGFGGHIPVLGVIDGRRIHDDDLNNIIENVSSLEENNSVDELVLTTTTWMDLIPYRYSLRKTIILSRLVERYAEERGHQVYTIWR